MSASGIGGKAPISSEIEDPDLSSTVVVLETLLKELGSVTTRPYR
jgi:hypothetical protein